MSFDGYLKEDTAATIKLGPFVNKTDGVASEVGLAAAMNHATTGVLISKGGGTLAARTTLTLPVYDDYGYYLVNLDATDTGTPGTLKVVYADPTTTLPCEANFQIVHPVVYDSLFGAAGTDQLDVTLNAAVQLPNIPNDWITSDGIAFAAIESTKFAAGAINAAAIAANAIDNATFAADVGSTALGTNMIAKAAEKAIGVAGASLTGITGAALAADQAVNATKLGGATVTATTSITFPSTCTVATTTGAVGSVTGAVGSVTGAIGSVTAAVDVGSWLGTAVTAATAGFPNVNVEYVNNAEVIGDGNATPWDGI